MPGMDSRAVLPLQNFSGDPEQEYFADGMTEALITELAHIHALRVVSRTSVARYKGSRKTVPEIARELGVQAILEGAVERVGERVRISARLIRHRLGSPCGQRAPLVCALSHGRGSSLRPGAG